MLGRSRCIVLGVESWLAPDRLRMLDDAWRAKSRRNVDGFIPGEAATALLVEPTKWAEQRGATALAGIAGVGVGREPETFSSDKQSSGQGLAEALRTVVSGRPPARWVLCDLNGESYRAIEWGLVQVRLGDEMAAVEKLLHPANCHGDIGAATGGALMAIAATAFRRGYAPPGDAVLFCGSDGEIRAATRLERV
jgi:3-oxoacyl-[acyl-carrier-protein] synthase-1